MNKYIYRLLFPFFSIFVLCAGSLIFIFLLQKDYKIETCRSYRNEGISQYNKGILTIGLHDTTSVEFIEQLNVFCSIGLKGK